MLAVAIAWSRDQAMALLSSFFHGGNGPPFGFSMPADIVDDLHSVDWYRGDQKNPCTGGAGVFTYDRRTRLKRHMKLLLVEVPVARPRRASSVRALRLLRGS